MHVLTSLGFYGWCRSPPRLKKCRGCLPPALPPTPPARKLAARCGSRGASNGDCGAVFIGQGGPEARPRTYLGPHRCALLLYHWGPRLPSGSLGGRRIFSSPAKLCRWSETLFPIGLLLFHSSSFPRHGVARPLGSLVAWRPVSVPLASRPRPCHGAFRVAPLCSALR